MQILTGSAMKIVEENGVAREEIKVKGVFKIKGIFGSGMVLQRNKINCIYGTAEVYSDVIMEFRGVTSITQADEDGNWKLEFSPGEAGGPFTMVIKSDTHRVEFTDVFVGEVWVSSGQSNAQLPMERMKFSYPEEFEQPLNDKIRMITIPINWSLDGEKDEIADVGWQSNADEGTKAENMSSGVKWVCASPENLGGMSGLGYFFAKKLSKELDVPVGIINASQGGSPIASWLSRQALEELGDKEEYLKKVDEFLVPGKAEATQKEFAENQKRWSDELYGADKKPDFSDSGWIASDEGWPDVKIPGNIPVEKAGFVWFKKTLELTAEQVSHFNTYKTWLWMGTIVDADTAWVNGVQVGFTPYCYPPRRYPVPKGTLHEGKNVIALRVQKNSANGPIRFFDEKPYYLFTDNTFVAPCAYRNLEERTESLYPLDGERIDLSGEWKLKVDAKVRDCPAGMFFEWLPTALYNSMLAPCFKHAIAGALWYQGESDAMHPAEYKGMLVKMIDLWRHKFVYGSKDLPFVIVQLPNWSDGWNEASVNKDGGWANIRQVQSDVAELAGHTGLVVAIDAGEWNDLHPEKKKTVGYRAAKEALRVAYGKNFISASPKAELCEYKHGRYRVRFDCGNSSLVACKVFGKKADLNAEGKDKVVYGFSLLCSKKGNETIIEADAKLVDDYTVEVEVPRGVGDVLELRYLWADSPAPVNLYSRNQLPAAPFRIVQQ